MVSVSKPGSHPYLITRRLQTLFVNKKLQSKTLFTEKSEKCFCELYFKTLTVHLLEKRKKMHNLRQEKRSADCSLGQVTVPKQLRKIKLLFS